MIVVSDRVIELNVVELAAANAIGFPFGKFKCKTVGLNGSHLRVTFPDADVCDKWKRRIFAQV